MDWRSAANLQYVSNTALVTRVRPARRILAYGSAVRSSGVPSEGPDPVVMAISIDLVYIQYIAFSGHDWVMMALLSRASARKRLVQWPESVDDRLEALVRLAMSEGEQLSCAQLLGALVATFPTDAGEISRRLRDYRRMHEEDFQAQFDSTGLPELKRLGPRRTRRD